MFMMAMCHPKDGAANHKFNKIISLDQIMESKDEVVKHFMKLASVIVLTIQSISRLKKRDKKAINI